MKSKENYFSYTEKKSCAVAIGFSGSKTIEIIDKISDNSDWILAVETKLDVTLFVLISIYNANHM